MNIVLFVENVKRFFHVFYPPDQPAWNNDVDAGNNPWIHSSENMLVLRI